MPYCPECGIHYLQPNSTCVSCGRNLSDAFDSPDPKNETFGKTLTPAPNESVIDFGGFRPQVDSHLGKGLVKPQSMEVGADGFHFKYDQPPQKFVKSEALKDKVIEFRVTAPEEPPKQFVAKEADASNESPELSFLEETIAPSESGEQLLKEEPVSETAPADLPESREPGVSVNVIEPETFVKPATTAEAENPVEPESATPQRVESVGETEVGGEETGTEYPPVDDEPSYAEPLDEETSELPEPELKGFEPGRPEEPETLWEGKGSWYGFGARTQYRITNQSVVIVEPYSYRFTEFELALISNVKLNRSWLMKLLGIGDISVSVNGLPEPGLTLKGIREPEKVKRLLEELLA
ncbi:MAG TPA: PH domain-containing protein [Bacillota bacterium]|nr:PH domain-containing protein [Bacillota bacterium]